HLHGPRSPEAYWAIEYVDSLIGRVLATLPAPEETNVFVVSDHGFLPVSRELRPNVRLRKLGLLEADADGRIGRAEASVVRNHAFFLAAGPQIRRGLEIPVFPNRNVAPTIASTLGVDMGAIEGRALVDIFS